MSEATRFDAVNEYNRKFKPVKTIRAHRDPDARHATPSYLPVREDKIWKVPEGLTLVKVLRRHI